jgi:CheY-specific phosphatase CheX
MAIETPADARPVGPDTAPEVVNAFTAATVTAFQELTETPVRLREPVLVSGTPAKGDVCAFITLKRRLPGRLVCTFPRAVLGALTRRYLPAGVALTPEIVDDTAGEFANVIAGQAKTMLKGTPYHYALTTPVVNRGPIPPADLEGESRQLLFLFDTDMGSFAVQVVLPSCR